MQVLMGLLTPVLTWMEMWWHISNLQPPHFKMTHVKCYPGSDGGLGSTASKEVLCYGCCWSEVFAMTAAFTGAAKHLWHHQLYPAPIAARDVVACAEQDCCVRVIVVKLLSAASLAAN